MEEEKTEKRPRNVPRLVKTAFLVVVWICIGLCLEITGPTLIDLKLRTHTDYESVATAVSGRSVGFFIGSALGGLLVDKLGRYSDLMVAVCLDGMAGFTALLPWIPMTEVMFVISLIQGTCEGVINIAGQHLIISMWQDKSASPLHLLHGGFGVGSFIIPLVANPFLAEMVPETPPNSSLANMSSMTSLRPDYVTTTPAPTTTTEAQYDESTSHIEYAYAIAAVVVVCVSVVFYIYHFAGIRNRKQLSTNQSIDNENDEKKEGGLDDEQKVLTFKEMFNPATCADGKLLYGLQIFILVFLFFTQAAGGERVAGKFIRAFAIDYHHFSKDDGSYINTVFWLAFSAGRISGFVVVKWIPIRKLILIETAGCLIGSVALMIFGTSSPLALWIIMTFLAVFIAPLFPSGIGWANFHLEVTGVAITVFLLGGSIGGFGYMKLIGYLYDTYGPKTFMYTLLAYGIAAFVLAVLMTIVGARHGNRFEWDKNKGEKDLAITADTVNSEKMTAENGKTTEHDNDTKF